MQKIKIPTGIGHVTAEEILIISSEVALFLGVAPDMGQGYEEQTWFYFNPKTGKMVK